MSTNYKLSDIDPEDIEDVIQILEESFGVIFQPDELGKNTTFGNLCDLVLSKMNGQTDEECTTQQLYYKLRNIFSHILKVDKKTLHPKSTLITLLPKKNRRKIVSAIEKELGFKMHILESNKKMDNMFFGLMTFGILFWIFMNWQIGLSCVVLSIIGLRLSSMFGSEISLETFGDLVEKLAVEDYVLSRRNSDTYNPNEIENKIIELFAIKLSIKKEFLTRDTKFID